MEIGTKNNPFQSVQIIIQDESGRLFFHKNTSIVKGEVNLTLFGGKIEDEDNHACDRVITEVEEEGGLILKREALIKVCEDGPNEYEKGWFLAQIYFVLISKSDGVILAKHNDTCVFDTIELFNNSGESKNWKNFNGIKGLVNKALGLGN